MTGYETITPEIDFKKIMFIKRQQMQWFRHRKVMEHTQRPIIHIRNESLIGYEEDQDNDE